MNVPSIAFKDIKNAAMNTKSEASNAKLNVIGIKNLISPGINNDPIKTVAPSNNAEIPVALLNKFAISPIKFEKKVLAVTFPISSKAFNKIEPIEQPAPTLQIWPVAIKNKSKKINIVINVIIFPILSWHPYK